MAELAIHLAIITEATAGGSRRHLRLVVPELRRRGAQVDLLLAPSQAEPDFDQDLARYRELGCRVFLVPLAKAATWRDLPALHHLTALLRELRPQVVHTHCAKAGVLGRLAARLAVPRAVVVHTPHSYFFEGLERPLARAVGIRLERWLNRRTAAVCCISEAERDQIARHRLAPPARVVVAPNGLPADFTATLRAREDVRAELGLADDQVAAAVCARLVPKKGHLWLLAALARMAPELRDRLRVYFIGAGPQRPVLERRLAELRLGDVVRCLGYRPAAERLLPGMDLALLPSYYEGLPYQLLEALAAGLPVIATDIPGHRLAGPGCPVLYTAPDATDELAALLEGLIQEADDRLRLGRQGAAWVQHYYPLDRQLEQLCALYARLTAAPAQSSTAKPV